ncbi:hypothetical protein PYCC9005_004366 [Savitreella phatthalungensis]
METSTWSATESIGLAASTLSTKLNQLQRRLRAKKSLQRSQLRIRGTGLRKLRRSFKSYVRLLNAEKETLPSSEAVSEAQNQASHTWSRTEKEIFFRSLARHSRLRPDLIAGDLKSRSELEVLVYIDRLETAYAGLLESARQSGKTIESVGLTSFAELPAAAEISPLTINAEERLSRRLCFETDSVCSTKEIDTSADLLDFPQMENISRVLFSRPVAMNANVREALTRIVVHLVKSLVASSIERATDRLRVLPAGLWDRYVMRRAAASGEDQPDEDDVGAPRLLKMDVRAAVELAGLKIDARHFWADIADDIRALPRSKRAALHETALEDFQQDLDGQDIDKAPSSKWLLHEFEASGRQRMRLDSYGLLDGQSGDKRTGLPPDQDQNYANDNDDDGNIYEDDGDEDEGVASLHDGVLEALDMHRSAVVENELRECLGLMTAVPVPSPPLPDVLSDLNRQSW